MRMLPHQPPSQGKFKLFQRQRGDYPMISKGVDWLSVSYQVGLPSASVTCSLDRQHTDVDRLARRRKDTAMSQRPLCLLRLRMSRSSKSYGFVICRALDQIATPVDRFSQRYFSLAGGQRSCTVRIRKLYTGSRRLLEELMGLKGGS